MPLLKEIPIDKGLLLLWKITEDIQSLLQLCGEVPDLDGFEKFKSPRRKKEWLAVRLLLKHIGCSEIKVSYNEHNQPSIKHPVYRHISISHSGEIAGILLHRSATVGLDIEILDRDYRKIENKYLSQNEKEMASVLEIGHALFWCSKEAVYKAVGVSGIDFSKQIHLGHPEGNQLLAKVILEKETRKYLLNYLEIENHLVAYLIDNQNN